MNILAAKPPTSAAAIPIVSVGFHLNIGANRQRTLLEDRVHAETIARPDGHILTLGIVADGIGGERAGERAAELTIDHVVDFCKTAPESEMPRLLQGAVESANAAVFAEAKAARHKLYMGATVAIAAIHANRLYVANAGDSRVYLVRGSSARQLTVDHTWAYDIVKAGKLTPEEASRHPKKDEITRSVGYEPTIDVDQHIYVDSQPAPGGEAQPVESLELLPGDRVVVCSDGLIKEYATGKHFVEPEEIARIVNAAPPQEAAEQLVKAALVRRTNDNVSAVVLEVPGGRRPFRIPRNVKIALAGGAGALVLIAAVFALFAFLPGLFPAQPTPLPTLPPVAEGQLYVAEVAGKLSQSQPPNVKFFASVSAGQLIPFTPGMRLKTDSQTSYARLGIPGQVEIYLAPDTEIEWRTADASSLVLMLHAGRMFIRMPDDFPAARIFSVMWPENTDPLNGVHGKGSAWIGVKYDPNTHELRMDCYDAQYADANLCQVARQTMRAFTVSGTLQVSLPPGTRAELWQFVPGFPAPTATPTNTSTPTETSTPTFTPTPIPPTRVPPTRVPPTIFIPPPTLLPEVTLTPTILPPTNEPALPPPDTPCPIDPSRGLPVCP